LLRQSRPVGYIGAVQGILKPKILAAFLKKVEILFDSHLTSYPTFVFNNQKGRQLPAIRKIPQKASA
jgi:hypothetical protein